MPNDFTYIRLDRRIRGLVIHDVELYGKSRLIERWFRDLRKDYERNAKALAPVNKRPKGPGKRPPGALKASIRMDQRREGPRRLQSTLSIGVNYATFVVRGTQGPIFAHNPKGMRIYHKQINRPRRPNGDLYWWFYAVKGQRRNAFLDRAARVTAARHPSIRGLGKRGIGL